LNLLH